LIYIQELLEHRKDVCEIAELDEMIKGKIFDVESKLTKPKQ